MPNCRVNGELQILDHIHDRALSAEAEVARERVIAQHIDDGANTAAVRTMTTK